MGGPPCPVGSVQRGIYEVVNGPRDRGQSWALKLMFRVTHHQCQQDFPEACGLCVPWARVTWGLLRDLWLMSVLTVSKGISGPFCLSLF